MNNTLRELIAALPIPTIFEEVKVETKIAENIALMKKLNPTWNPIESDSNMMQIEAFSYKEVMLINIFNNAIKKMLPHYCEEEDLDNFIFGFYAGETRLQGSYPSASYEFELEEALSVNIIIPKGLQLSDGNTLTAYLDENVTISAGELKATGKVKLELKEKTSDVKTETVISPYPYVIKVTSKEEFKGGSSVESDVEFFERAILSLYKYSTAGGEKAYIYHAKSADERVFDVKIISPAPRLITVAVLVNDADIQSEVIAVVNERLNGNEKIQAFDDVVTVEAAVAKDITRAATIHIFDLTKQAEITDKIAQNMKDVFKIGEAFPNSQLIKLLHVSGVYKVVLDSVEDMTVLPNEYIKLTINKTFVEAVL